MQIGDRISSYEIVRVHVEAASPRAYAAVHTILGTRHILEVFVRGEDGDDAAYDAWLAAATRRAMPSTGDAPRVTDVVASSRFSAVVSDDRDGAQLAMVRADLLTVLHLRHRAFLLRASVPVPPRTEPRRHEPQRLAPRGGRQVTLDSQTNPPGIAKTLVWSISLARIGKVLRTVLGYLVAGLALKLCISYVVESPKQPPQYAYLPPPLPAVPMTTAKPRPFEVSMGDRLVTDTRSGLVWRKQPLMGVVTRTQAEQSCRALDNGTAGWRLPRPEELGQLFDADWKFRAESPAIDRYFEMPPVDAQNVKTAAWIMWTDAPSDAAGNGQCVDFNSDGLVACPVAEPHGARCVRTVPVAPPSLAPP